MKILLAYFSFTGNTEKVSKLILKCLQESGINCDIFKIEPILKLKYLPWLFLSFIPGLPFPVKNLKLLNLGNYDAIILGSPKWSLSCPPVTYFIRFLKSERLKAKSSLRIFLFITYGGFGEDVGAIITPSSSFFTSKKFDNFYKRGDKFISFNYDDAQKKINIFIESGLGNIRVRWTE